MIVMEQALGLFRGHLHARAPSIIQLSTGARKYAGVTMLEAIIRAGDDAFRDAVYAVHFDHGDEPTCYECIDSGFYSSVMIDTDGRLVWTRVHREHCRDYPDDFDFRTPGERFVKESATFVAEKSEELLSADTLPAVRAARAGGAAPAREVARAG